MASVGSRGDSYDNALAEAFNSDCSRPNWSATAGRGTPSTTSRSPSPSNRLVQPPPPAQRDRPTPACRVRDPPPNRGACRAGVQTLRRSRCLTRAAPATPRPQSSRGPGASRSLGTADHRCGQLVPGNPRLEHEHDPDSATEHPPATGRGRPPPRTGRQQRRDPLPQRVRNKILNHDGQRGLPQRPSTVTHRTHSETSSYSRCSPSSNHFLRSRDAEPRNLGSVRQRENASA